VGEREELSDQEMDAFWAVLGGSDAIKACESLVNLCVASDSSVSFLRKHLRPAQPVDAGRIESLIKDLDSNQFDVRQKASGELERLGDLAAPAARKALQEKPSPETRRRLEQLLSTIDGHGNISDDRLRTSRAIEVLERIGTSEARQLLQALASGAPGALQTEEAKESFQRLAKDRPAIQKMKN